MQILQALMRVVRRAATDLRSDPKEDLCRFDSSGTGTSMEAVIRRNGGGRVVAIFNEKGRIHRIRGKQLDRAYGRLEDAAKRMGEEIAAATANMRIKQTGR